MNRVEYFAGILQGKVMGMMQEAAPARKVREKVRVKAGIIRKIKESDRRGRNDTEMTKIATSMIR